MDLKFKVGQIEEDLKALTSAHKCYIFIPVPCDAPARQFILPGKMSFSKTLIRVPSNLQR